MSSSSSKCGTPCNCAGGAGIKVHGLYEAMALRTQSIKVLEVALGSPKERGCD